MVRMNGNNYTVPCGSVRKVRTIGNIVVYSILHTDGKRYYMAVRFGKVIRKGTSCKEVCKSIRLSQGIQKNERKK